ncbi:Methyltransferase psoC [Paramyrothecium foliicola]|nr:Methyltransferase psoC [Paramyrothecium foliicola]
MADFYLHFLVHLVLYFSTVVAMPALNVGLEDHNQRAVPFANAVFPIDLGLGERSKNFKRQDVTSSSYTSHSTSTSDLPSDISDQPSIDEFSINLSPRTGFWTAAVIGGVTAGVVVGLILVAGITTCFDAVIIAWLETVNTARLDAVIATCFEAGDSSWPAESSEEARTFGSPLKCTLKKTHIHPSNSRQIIGYEALSYVWDQPLDNEFTPPESRHVKLTYSVEVGFETETEEKPQYLRPRIKSNLEMALRYLRLPDKERIIWTDSLCIDQDSDLEKNAQIPLMKHIYQNATRVVGWLSENNNGVLECLENVSEAYKKRSLYKPRELHGAHDDLRLACRDTLSRNDRKTLLRLARLPFWTRRWIIQEVALGKHFRLMVGNYFIDFSKTDFAVILEILDGHEMPEIDDFRVVIDEKALLDHGDTHKNTIRWRLRPMQLLHSYRNVRDFDFRLLDLVQGLRGWECGWPRDRVFALIGLVEEREVQHNKPEASAAAIAVATKRTKDDSKLAKDILEKVSFENDKLDVIETVCGMVEIYGRLVENYALLYGRLDGLNYHTGDHFHYLPTWVPNFHSRQKRFSLIEGIGHPGNWNRAHEPIFFAATEEKPDIQRIGNNPYSVLRVDGWEVDVVEDTAEACLCPGYMSFQEAKDRLQAWAKRVGPTIDQWQEKAIPDEYYGPAARYVSSHLSTLAAHITLKMAAKDPEYLLPQPEKEVARLNEQDAVITYHMNGKRILAPVDLSQKGLQILDSGTADGLWLREIQPLLSLPYNLYGFDVMPSFFPKKTPSHTSFDLHDIAEPWPEALHGKFDLVHQRATLLGGAKRSTPRECIQMLTKLVKPSGWIQLSEMDVTKPVEGGVATQHVWTALATWFQAAGATDRFANSMADWLREEGFENVREEYIRIDVGPRCKDLEWGARSTKVLLNAATGVVGALKMMNSDISESVIDRLPERAAEEWEREGATYGLICAISQKPIG